MVRKFVQICIISMAKYRMVAEIYVEGEEIKEKRDAFMALQEMLCAYDDMTETSSTTIEINTLKTEKV